MALDTQQLKTDIISILTDMSEREVNSIEEFAERLSSRLEVYVKTADIKYTNGLTSATGGTVTGTFNGNLE